VQPPNPLADTTTPEGFDLLAELAFDSRSSWNHQADELWEQMDSALWRDTGNAWLVLHSISHDRVRDLWQNDRFRQRALDLRERRRRDLSQPAWFQQAHAASGLRTVAFFSLEFAISEALPVYSGGLGQVAGDYLKAASDLGVPLVGVGLLYQQGYFRQAIGSDGAQHEFYPFNSTDEMPVVPLRDARGDRVRVRLPRPGPPVWLRGWAARVGRVALYLLDSNDPTNAPADRGITAQLYGGGPEVRLLQEMALGIGGWRLLRAIGLRPEVCHLNEGHAALVTLERARDYALETGQPFEVALAATRAGNVFTTHTPVASGFDRFAPDLVASYLGAYARDELGVSLETVLALGRAPTAGDGEPLSMAWLATRGSGAVNAVSRRHAEVSRELFQELFPRWPQREVPIGYVTNGVHVPSWDSAEADAFWTEACGEDRWRGTMEEVEQVRQRSDADLWTLRAKSRAELVKYVRGRLASQLAGAGMAGDALRAGSRALDADALTIGFARRFTAYKRPALLLKDPDRLLRLLTNPRRPVQLVIAGKAHPRDGEGRAFVQAWVQFVRRPEVRPHAVFLADYDLRLSERLVQGVDLWLNTPRPPWEASGTSGMKVLVNGGVNLSSLDGWWVEAYRRDVGYALQDGKDDERDATELYELLEREVIPAFYDRDPAGLPVRWLAKVRASMTTLTPIYSANRALREYTEEYYLPAAQAFARRIDGGGARAAQIVAWEHSLHERWSSVRFVEIRTRTEGDRHYFAATIDLDSIDPESVAVELYADADGSAEAVRTVMRRDGAPVRPHVYRYQADVRDDRPANRFTPRVLPAHADGRIPLELPLITWPA
jgi:starch phosphorylase